MSPPIITPFTRWCGVALCLAAVVTLAINVTLSPFLPKGSFAVIAASDIYFLRQCSASLAAWLLVFGIIGIHTTRLGRAGPFATIAFVVALTGAVGLFALEYGQAFTVHDYALHAPQALDAALASPGTPLTIGALMAIATFYLGWLLIALSILIVRDFPRSAGALILAGFVVAPILHATGSFSAYAGIAASLVVGSGWFLIGLRMIRGNSVLAM